MRERLGRLSEAEAQGLCSTIAHTTPRRDRQSSAREIEQRRDLSTHEYSERHAPRALGRHAVILLLPAPAARSEQSTADLI